MIPKLGLVFIFLAASLGAQTTAQGWNDQGYESLMEENYLKALEDFRGALKLNPNYLEAKEGLVQAYFSLGDFEEAGLVVADAVKLGSGEPRVKVLQGRVLLGQGKYEEGLKLFQEVLSKEPKNKGAFFGRAEYYVLTGKYLLAQKDYQEIIKVEPDNLRAHLALIILNLHLNRTTEIPSLLSNALHSHSADPLTHWWAAQYYLKIKDLNSAQIYVDNYLRLKKSTVTDPQPGYLAKGLIFKTVLLLIQNKPADATETITQVVSETPEFAYGWYLKGLAEYRSDKIDAAMGSFRRCLGLEKENEMARIALENLVILDNKLENLTELRETLANFHFALGKEALSNSRLSLAYDEYRRGLLINPDSLPGHRKKAEILKTQNYLSSYRSELYHLENQYGLKGFPTAFLDEIEIQKSLYPDSLPDRWNIKVEDLEIQDPRTLSIGIFYQKDLSQLEYYSGDDHLSQFLQNELSTNRTFSFLSALKKSERQPAPVASTTEAFQTARSQNLDFYLLLEFREGFRDFTAVANLYLGSNGKFLQAFPVYKKGLLRISSGLRDLSRNIGDYFPLWGYLTQKKGKLGLIGLGSRDGVQKDMKFTLIKRGKPVLTGDKSFLKYSEADTLGTFTVTSVDDRLAEGEWEKIGFYDLITPGDEVVLFKDPVKPTPVVWPSHSELQKNILGLRN